MHQNYWALALEPVSCNYWSLHIESLCSATEEATTVRSLYHNTDWPPLVMTWESPSKARKMQTEIKINKIIKKGGIYSFFSPRYLCTGEKKMIRSFGDYWILALNWHWFQMTPNITVVHQSSVLWSSGDQWYFSLHPFHSEPHWVSQTILWLFLQFQNVQWEHGI